MAEASITTQTFAKTQVRNKMMVSSICPKCDGRGWAHTSNLKHLKPSGRKCFFCSKCSGCDGNGILAESRHFCRKCEGRGWHHASVYSHNQNKNQKCYFCTDCHSCTGKGTFRQPAENLTNAGGERYEAGAALSPTTTRTAATIPSTQMVKVEAGQSSTVYSQTIYSTNYEDEYYAQCTEVQESDFLEEEEDQIISALKFVLVGKTEDATPMELKTFEDIIIEQTRQISDIDKRRQRIQSTFLNQANCKFAVLVTSQNDFGISWTGGKVMKLRVEGGKDTYMMFYE